MPKQEFFDLMRENILLVDWLIDYMSNNISFAGYSKQHFRILVLFSMIGKTTLKNFSKHTEIPTSNLCTILKHLEGDGLILNERDKVDRRNVWYSLTSEGEKAAKKIIKQFEIFLAKEFSQIDEKEEARLTDASRTLNVMFKRIKNSYVQGNI